MPVSTFEKYLNYAICVRATSILWLSFVDVIVYWCFFLFFLFSDHRSFLVCITHMHDIFMESKGCMIIVKAVEDFTYIPVVLPP